MIHTATANNILKYLTAQVESLTSAGKCYLGFSSSEPTAAGDNFTEPTTTDYSRIQLNIYDASTYTNKWGTPADGVVSNAAELCSPECNTEGGWTFTHFGIFSAKTGGTPMASGLLRDPDGVVGSDGLLPAKTLTVEKGSVAVFKVGTLQLTLQ